MKKMLMLLFSCSLLIISCRHDDVYENSENTNQHADALKGKSFVLNQTELEAKYAGNKSLNTILQKEFKTEGLIKANSVEGENGVYIDLDHIQVYESAQMHAITYYVEIGEQTETDEPQEMYNLMYFSKDYVNYHVILLRYDFSQIPFQQFITQPELTLNVLGFVPLNDIENIYENINYSISHGVNSTSSVKTNGNSSATFYQFADCVVVTVNPPQPCQVCGLYKGEVKDGKKCVNDNPATMPKSGSVIYDFTDCGNSNGGGTGGGGNPGSGVGGTVGAPGTGWTPGTNPSSPIWSNPIKNPGRVIEIGELISDFNIGVNNKNLEVLNDIVTHNLPTLQDLYSKASDVREHGNAFIKVKKNGKYVALANQTPLPLNNGSNWQLDIESAVKNKFNTGILHTHTNKNTTIYEYNQPTKADPMFSHTDLRALFLLSADNATNKKELPDLFVGLMTSESLYVVMFPNDATKDNFNSKYGTPFFTWKTNDKMWKDLGKELRKEYSKINPSTATDALKAKMYEKALLRVLKDNNLPLNFYRLDANNGQFNGSWKLLGLDANGNVTENQGY
ncbi:hypothetical protein P3875_02445 [Myroides sp. JBRI-B21084]|uniref:hypothetical protein n=1 Tax=Myroides sp. JBRI-B21084 TaxID=3119977 RepID=UPI0026E13217|nr:hypothetical protein [Paenimyroides cloacae]WKW46934.1 hypothetical protein P3875_02445 [Paenimyroides cloacae]